jgi:hypothetical protein
LVGRLEGERHSDNLGVDERIILEWILETGWEVVDWIYMA